MTIKSLINRAKNIFMRSNLRTKINLYYLIIFITVFFISYGIYNMFNERIVEKQVSISSGQTLHALDKNLNFMLDEVATFSNLIFFDKEVQNALRSVKSEGADPNRIQLFNKYLVNMLLSGGYISSVYLYDNYDNRYAMGKRGVHPLTIDKIEDAYWYKQAMKLDGNLLWVKNSGGVLQNENNENYISLIRIIKDLKNFDKLAVLIVNVDEEKIVEQFKEISDGGKSHFFVLNNQGQYITHPDIDMDIVEEEIKPNLKGSEGYFVKNIDNSKMITRYITSQNNDWTIVGVMPLDESSKQWKSLSYIAIVILVLNSIFLSIGGIFIAKFITKPLLRMQKYMKKVEQGNFETMPVQSDRTDEIVQLQKGYNKMIGEIETLIYRVKEEQKVIRKNELNLLRSQVNPHFLYNTLDAISALSLLGDNEKAFKITQSLGEFYRISLSSGKEIITVEEEINCIKSYVTILDIRYNNKFEVFYEIEETILELKVLKLILQPLVENAVHHGLRNKQGNGRIEIKGYRENSNIVFKVIDDGIGMSQKRIDEIINFKQNKGGFGLYSSRQRISIYYNIENPISIVSEEGKGTEITITIPIME